MTTARSAPLSSLFVTRFTPCNCLPCLFFVAATPGRQFDKIARPMNNRGGTRLVNAVKKCHPSVFATLASAGERRLKRPAYAVAKGVQRPPSSARPLETKRLQRLSRKSRSHRSKRDRRTLSFLRAAPATAEHHPRALARALPARLVERSGPRQRTFRRQSFLALNPGDSAGRGN